MAAHRPHDVTQRVSENAHEAADNVRQKVRYVTERCVLELREHGMTVIEIAPGVDLQRDVLDKAAFKLHVADDLREMDARLFRPEAMNLELPGGGR